MFAECAVNDTSRARAARWLTQLKGKSSGLLSNKIRHKILKVVVPIFLRVLAPNTKFKISNFGDSMPRVGHNC